MYEHPLTATHLRIVRDVIGYTVVGPIGKTLACGDIGVYIRPPRNIDVGEQAHLRLMKCTGIGAMSEWTDIVRIVVDRFGLVLVEQERKQ